MGLSPSVSRLSASLAGRMPVRAAPGGGPAGELPGGLEEAELHDPLEEPLPLVVVRRPGHVQPGQAPGTVPVHSQLRDGGVVGFPGGEPHPGDVRVLPLVDGPLLGEEGQEALLHGVPVVVALPKINFIASSPAA